MVKFLTILLACFFVSGCVTQDEMDVKMAKGCAAGVNALLEDESKEILEIKSKRYANEDTEGGLHRRITIEAIEKDGWVELDKEYSCLFMQEWGMFKSSHRALLVQVEINDTLYGKKNGSIVGSFEDFLRLTKVIDSAMAP